MVRHMSTNHTPGPWEYKEPYGAVAVKGKTVCMTDNHYVATEWAPFPESEERRANGRLIAAAPELLAAVEAALSVDIPLRYGIREQMESAVLKAKGVKP